MKFLSQIIVYPVKGLGGISLQEAVLTKTGLDYDRLWMLIDKEGNFLSQRSVPEMCLMKSQMLENGIGVFAPDGTSVRLPFENTEEIQTVKIWDDSIPANLCGSDYDQWFSEKLGLPCRLVKFHDQVNRTVDDTVENQNYLVGFADAFSILLTSEASLSDLNNRLSVPVEMNRFRPNLVFAGGIPFEEDGLGEFSLGEARFRAVKACSRCQVITVNQQTGEQGVEPLKTLATYRTSKNKVMFGENCICLNPGARIKVGQEMVVKSTKPGYF